ncbi:hypothetical protein [Streptomyces bobili]
MPASELTLFPKLDHFGPEKDPAGIATALTTFFLNTAQRPPRPRS